MGRVVTIQGGLLAVCTQEIRYDKFRHDITARSPMRPSRLLSAGAARAVLAHDATWPIAHTGRTWTHAHQCRRTLRAPWGRKARSARPQMHLDQMFLACNVEAEQGHCGRLTTQQAHGAVAIDETRAQQGCPTVHWSNGEAEQGRCGRLPTQQAHSAKTTRIKSVHLRCLTLVT